MSKPKYDCSKCPGYCCSYPVIQVTKRDAMRIAKHFGLSLENLIPATKIWRRMYESEKQLATDGLARLFSKPANLLVLDEPTNDLDVETLELLEELLMDFDGTLLLVSHDRAFLDNVVTSTLVFEGQGRVGEYVGGYSDWLRQRGTAPVSEGGSAKTREKPR